jgi:hypothetical protein
VENGFGALIQELGILGPILWILWGGSALASAIATAMKLKGTWAFPIAISVVLFVFMQIFPLMWGSLVSYQNFVVNAYLWLFLGILFKLPVLVERSGETFEEGIANPK